MHLATNNLLLPAALASVCPRVSRRGVMGMWPSRKAAPKS